MGFRGKALQDGTNLSEYKLTDGSKLNLVLKRRENSPLTSSDKSSQGATNHSNTLPKEPFIASPSSEVKPALPTSTSGSQGATSKTKTVTNQQPQATIKPHSNTKPLEEELYRALRPHFRTNDDTKRVVITFKQVC